MSRARASLLIASLLIVGAGGCANPSPTSHSEASTQEGPPGGQLIRIDLGVAMAADDRTLTIRFIGGPVLTTADPCYTGYEGWGSLVGQHLDVAVVLVTDVHPPSGTACAGAGFERSVKVTLGAPFLGSTAQDLSDGHAIEIERPQESMASASVATNCIRQACMRSFRMSCRPSFSSHV